jgi:hypothetical protein
MTSRLIRTRHRSGSRRHGDAGAPSDGRRAHRDAGRRACRGVAGMNLAAAIVAVAAVLAGSVLIAALLWADYENECDHQRQMARMRRLADARDRQHT